MDVGYTTAHLFVNWCWVFGVDQLGCESGERLVVDPAVEWVHRFHQPFTQTLNVRAGLGSGLSVLFTQFLMEFEEGRAKTKPVLVSSGLELCLSMVCVWHCLLHVPGDGVSPVEEGPTM